MNRLHLKRTVVVNNIKQGAQLKLGCVVVMIGIAVGWQGLRVCSAEPPRAEEAAVAPVGEAPPAPQTAPMPPLDASAMPSANDQYLYDSQGRRDPMESLIKEISIGTGLSPIGRDPDRPLGPLERFDISVLKLVAIVWGELGRKGLIKAPDGKSYFVTADTYLGRYGGKIVTIENDRLVIEEFYRDLEEKIVPKTLFIPLRRKDKKEG